MDAALNVSLEEALKDLPDAPTSRWPFGTYDREFFRKDGFSASIFAPRGQDFQSPHDDDELYMIVSGRGKLEVGEEVVEFEPGHMIYVPAKLPHRFIDPADDLAAWVVFLPSRSTQGA